MCWVHNQRMMVIDRIVDMNKLRFYNLVFFMRYFQQIERTPFLTETLFWKYSANFQNYMSIARYEGAFPQFPFPAKTQGFWNNICLLEKTRLKKTYHLTTFQPLLLTLFLVTTSNFFVHVLISADEPTYMKMHAVGHVSPTRSTSSFPSPISLYWFLHPSDPGWCPYCQVQTFALFLELDESVKTPDNFLGPEFLEGENRPSHKLIIEIHENGRPKRAS